MNYYTRAGYLQVRLRESGFRAVSSDMKIWYHEALQISLSFENSVAAEKGAGV